MTKQEMIREFSNKCHTESDIERLAVKRRKARVEEVWSFFKKRETEHQEDIKDLKEFCWAVL